MSSWNKKPEFVTLDKFNEYLEMSKPYVTVPYDPRNTEYDTIGGRRFLWQDNKLNQHLIFKDHVKSGKAFHVALDLYDMKERTEDPMEGWEAFRKSLNPYIIGCREKIYLEGNDAFLEFRTEQFQWCDDKRANEWTECWSYDINSCFLSFLDYDLPDNRIKREWSVVESGEMGFIDEYGYLKMVKKGEVARWVFDKRKYRSLMKFKHAMYNHKLKSENDEEREFWKDCMVKSIGYLKYVNVFLRSAILNYAKARIVSAMDENTVYCNTDSIISLKPRDDLDIGPGCGQFKNEHAKTLFIYKSIGICVWYGESIKYRGMKKSYINEDDDHYWIYYVETVMYDYRKNRMIYTGKKGYKEELWQKPKPGSGQPSTETPTTAGTTPSGTE